NATVIPMFESFRAWWNGPITATSEAADGFRDGSPHPGDRSSVDCEAVEKSGPAGAPEVRLAAATIRSARGMRGIPRLRFHIVAQAFAVDMPEHRRSLAAARPILAGAVFAGWKRTAIHRRARERVMLIGAVAAALGRVALFRKCGLFGEIVGAV